MFRRRISTIFACCILLCGLSGIGVSQRDLLSEAIASLSSPDAAVRLSALITVSSGPPERIFDPLVSVLTDPDDQIKESAIITLGYLKDKRASSSLVPLLQDKNGNIQVKAAWALGNIGDGEAVEPLLDALATAEPGMKLHIIEALGHLDDPRAVQPLFELKALDALADGKSAVEPMCEILTKGSWPDRWYAMSVLEKNADERSTTALVSVLGVGESGIGVSAANTLARRIGKPATEPLIAALRSREPRARANAMLALGQIDDERAAWVLLNAVNDEDALVRKQLAEALGMLTGGPAYERIVGALLKAMRDTDPEVRLAALKGLARIERDDVAQAIFASLSDPAMTVEASAILAERRDLRALPYLLTQLKSEDHFTAGRAARSLTEIGTPAVDGLIAMLADKNPEFPRREATYRQQEANSPYRWMRCGNGPLDPMHDPRALAATALGEIGDERARSPLSAALKDHAEWLRLAAAAALEKLNPKE